MLTLIRIQDSYFESHVTMGQEFLAIESFPVVRFHLVVAGSSGVSPRQGVACTQPDSSTGPGKAVLQTGCLCPLRMLTLTPNPQWDNSGGTGDEVTWMEPQTSSLLPREGTARWSFVNQEARSHQTASLPAP